MFVTLSYRTVFKVKLGMSVYLYVLALKSAINFLLQLEVHMEFTQDIPNLTERSFSSAVAILVYSLTAVFLAQYFVNTVWGFCESCITFIWEKCKKKSRPPKKIIKRKNQVVK